MTRDYPLTTIRRRDNGCGVYLIFPGAGKRWNGP